MYNIPPLQYLSRIFTSASKITLPNIRKVFIKATFLSPFQYLDGSRSLSKSLSTLKFYFRAVREGAGYKTEGGQVSFTPTKRGAEKNYFSHAEGGGWQMILR